MISIAFSVLCHYTSILTDECIILGILFHNINDNVYRFEHTHNWERVRTFDDELDIDFLKVQLKSIKEEVEVSLPQYRKGFCISDYTRFYVNELKFTKVCLTNSESFNDFVEESKKVYLRFDYDKKERPSYKDQIQYAKKILKDYNINFDAGNVNGYFNDPIKFDFIINDYAFKFFTFDGKNTNYLISTVRNWAYNAYKLKDKYKVVFITDAVSYNDNNRTLLNILKEESHDILNLSEFMSYIEKIKKVS